MLSSSMRMSPFSAMARNTSNTMFSDSVKSNGNCCMCTGPFCNVSAILQQCVKCLLGPSLLPSQTYVYILRNLWISYKNKPVITFAAAGL